MLACLYKKLWRLARITFVVASFGAGTSRGSAAAPVPHISLSEPVLPYGTGQWSEKMGNHRVVVQVSSPAKAVWAHIPWRRRDRHPERKALWIIDAATQQRITNVVRIHVSRAYGDLLFQPVTAPGTYFIYYLPFREEGSPYFPTTVYFSPTNQADADWVQTCQPLVRRIQQGRTNDIPQAAVKEIQAINAFHSFYPMEVIATPNEILRLQQANAPKPFLTFPEDRLHPIRMTRDLPVRWIQSGPANAFSGVARRGEFYVFQIGVYANSRALHHVSVHFNPLQAPDGSTIPAAALRCFNLGGTNWLGKRFSKRVDVPKHSVQALWFGIQVPLDATPAAYQGTLDLGAQNAPEIPFHVNLKVVDQTVSDGGDVPIQNESRLRWLDSTVGLDNQVVPPYSPVHLKGRTVRVLGRQATFNNQGLLSSIQSRFTPSVDAADGPPTELLAAPIRFTVLTGQGPCRWQDGHPRIIEQTPGALAWESTSHAEGLDFRCRAKMESDGYINFRITLHADHDANLRDVRLDIPLRRAIATYMMGLGRQGGYRPKSWQWRWNIHRANNELWIGDVHAGLSCKLKDVIERWDMYNLEAHGLYRNWSNGGKGGCTVSEVGSDQVRIRAYTGPRSIARGQSLHFNFGLLITPVKVLDKRHWHWRYYHQSKAKPVPEVAKLGATIINIHQGDPLNPNINYPFLVTKKLKAYVREAHRRHIKVKLYYTVRELSDYTVELFALRSLGDEIFVNGPGFELADQFSSQPTHHPLKPTGSSWLCEHLITGYVPAWHQWLGNGRYDAAIATTGLSRWHNYYLEGLRWLLQNVKIDGLYLDGIGYDREIMKRVRKVLLRNRPGGLIDFHSGNNFHPRYGLNSPANQYMELFPYIDSLWFGEDYDYNKPPDYWLVEISGIPYGLFSEMLQGGGNPWRGMIYGMTSRLGWGGDPRSLWKLWDQFGIQKARMIGYWDPACPVTTGLTNVLATAYVRPNKTLISLASWAPQTARVHLKFKGIAPSAKSSQQELYAPAIAGFQKEARFRLSDPIPVAPGKGWLLILKSSPQK